MSQSGTEQNGPFRISEHERRRDAFDTIDVSDPSGVDISDSAITGRSRSAGPLLRRSTVLVLTGAVAVACLGIGGGVGFAVGGRTTQTAVTAQANTSAALSATDVKGLPQGISANTIIKSGTVEESGDLYAKQSKAVAAAVAKATGIDFGSPAKSTASPISVSGSKNKLLYTVSSPSYTAQKVDLSKEQRTALIDAVNEVVTKYGFTKFDLDSMYTGPYAEASARTAAFGTDDPLTGRYLTITGVGKSATESYAVQVTSPSQVGDDTVPGSVSIVFNSSPHVHKKDVEALRKMVRDNYRAADQPSQVATPAS